MGGRDERLCPGGTILRRYHVLWGFPIAFLLSVLATLVLGPPVDGGDEGAGPSSWDDTGPTPFVADADGGVRRVAPPHVRGVVGRLGVAPGLGPVGLVPSFPAHDVPIRPRPATAVFAGLAKMGPRLAGRGLVDAPTPGLFAATSLRRPQKHLGLVRAN